MADCRHQAVPGLTLMRCPVHSDVAGDVFVWSWTAMSARRAACPCVVGDRFVVAAEPVPEPWSGSVDVVLVAARPTLWDAMLVQVPTGCTLVVVPVPLQGKVFRTARGAVLVDNGRIWVCGVCLYPWLVSGRDPFGLARQAVPPHPPASAAR